MARPKLILTGGATLVSSAALLFTSCSTPSGGTAGPPVTPALVQASHGASIAMLQEGRSVFFGACTSCHAPDPISKYSLPQWEATIEKMAPRARLDAGRRAALIAYIRSAKALPVTATASR